MIDYQMSPFQSEIEVIRMLTLIEEESKKKIQIIEILRSTARERLQFKKLQLIDRDYD